MREKYGDFSKDLATFVLYHWMVLLQTIAKLRDQYAQYSTWGYKMDNWYFRSRTAKWNCWVRWLHWLSWVVCQSVNRCWPIRWRIQCGPISGYPRRLPLAASCTFHWCLESIVLLFSWLYFLSSEGYSLNFSLKRHLFYFCTLVCIAVRLSLGLEPLQGKLHWWHRPPVGHLYLQNLQ